MELASAHHKQSPPLSDEYSPCSFVKLRELRERIVFDKKDQDKKLKNKDFTKTVSNIKLIFKKYINTEKQNKSNRNNLLSLFLWMLYPT